MKQALSNPDLRKHFSIHFDGLFQRKSKKLVFRFFPLFFGEFQQNERTRGLKTDHLFYKA